MCRMALCHQRGCGRGGAASGGAESLEAQAAELAAAHEERWAAREAEHSGALQSLHALTSGSMVVYSLLQLSMTLQSSEMS